MLLFLIIFSIVNLLVNAFIYWRMRPLFPKGRAVSLIMMLFMLVMLSLFIISRLLRDLLGEVSLGIADAGSLWFGFTMLATASCVFTLILQSVCKITPAAALKKLAADRRLWAGLCLLLALAASAWSVWEARHPGLEKVNIASPYYHGAPVNILQISDLHLGSMGGEPAMARALEFYQQTQPDMLVITGDFIDGSRQIPASWSQPWQSLKPPLGKFAVLGNHEALGDYVEQNLDFLRQCGFIILRNFGIALNEHIYIAGVDDPRFNNEIDESSLWPNNRPELFRLLLKHRPDVELFAERGFDLQLSGHTHGGQFYPGYWFTKLRHPMNQGLYQLPHHSYLYVDKGLGTWGPPMRFLTPPQATLLTVSASQ